MQITSVNVRKIEKEGSRMKESKKKAQEWKG